MNCAFWGPFWIWRDPLIRDCFWLNTYVGCQPMAGEGDTTLINVAEKNQSEALPLTVSPFSLPTLYPFVCICSTHTHEQTHIITTLAAITSSSPRVGCPLHLGIIFVHSRLRLCMQNGKIILYNITCSFLIDPSKSPY